MNINQLSKRLACVASYIPENSIVADIGSDHAYLPCYAIHKGLAQKAVAGEVVDGPFQSAVKHVKEAGLTERIDVRKGSGLEVLTAGEVDCITIAGMGGALIATILDEGKAKLDGVQRLVLQPNLSAITIRKWLIANKWQLIAEEILEEDGKIYEVLVAEKGEPLIPYSENKQEQELLMGPFLLKKKNLALYEKWNREATQLESVLESLKMAGDQVTAQKKQLDVLQEIQLIKEALHGENPERA